MVRVLCILFLLLTGFPVQAQREKSFTILKEPRQGQAPIPLDGIYLKKGPVKWSESFSMYFFNTGVFFSSVEHNSYIQAKDDQDFINIITNIDVGKSNCGTWGFYRIKADTLTTQKKFREPGRGWRIMETKWIIKEDRMYKLSYEELPTPYFKKPKVIPTEDTAAYVFYPTTIKPDSTQAWFYNVDWYQKYK